MLIRGGNHGPQAGPAGKRLELFEEDVAQCLAPALTGKLARPSDATFEPAAYEALDFALEGARVAAVDPHERLGESDHVVRSAVRVLVHAGIGVGIRIWASAGDLRRQVSLVFSNRDVPSHAAHLPEGDCLEPGLPLRLGYPCAWALASSM